MKKVYSLLGLILFSFYGFAQNGINKEKFRLNIKRAVDEIIIDGKLNERSWQEADQTSPFRNKWPTDKGLPPLQSNAKVTYDDKFLYISAVCQEENADHVIQTLKRDNVIWSSDGFGVFLDPVNQQTNGFAFFVNAYGVQTEGLLSAFQSDDEGMSRDWDNKWFAETHQTEEGEWSLEMAIPFKTLRYDDRNTEWGINFLRCDIGNNMYSTWAFIPLQFNGTDLGYTGTLVWDNSPPKTNSNFSIIPYITGSLAKDVEEEDGDVMKDFDAGLDAKVAVTSSLNLDLTYNPDFSQIEVDDQQTNLTRFSLFFPEKRTFFLENSDIFSDFGLPPVRPFFSRRIGLDDDGNAIPILFGARLSGNLLEDTRIGLMSMQTAETDSVLGQNYSVATFQQQVFGRSSFKGIFINRQAYQEGDFVKDDFGRNIGGEFDYVKPDGSLSAWANYHISLKPEKFKSNNFYNLGFQYNTRRFSTTQSVASVGENYIADVGFVNRLENYDAERDTSIRIGYRHLYQTLQFSLFPKKDSSKINFSELRFQNFMVWNDKLGQTTRNLEATYSLFFKNTSWMNIGLEHQSEFVPFPINFTGDEFENLPSDWYYYGNVFLWFRSNQRRLLSYTIRSRAGTFYNGSLVQLGGSLNYRRQPWGNFSLNFERSIINLPDEYGETKLWLLGPKIEINFSKSIFWTTFVQYNTQSDNFNINSRLQWRYQPMSDLFLVYTDNYAIENFGLKSRALVLKFNYWLTI